MSYLRAMKLGERVRLARESKGLKQEELAKAIGMSQAGLSKLEKSKTAEKTKFAIEISRATDVSLDWLTTGKGEMTSNQVKEPPSRYAIDRPTLARAMKLVDLVIEKNRFVVDPDEKLNIYAVIYEELLNSDDEVTDREISLLLKAVKND